jgi:hypothetical protein
VSSFKFGYSTPNKIAMSSSSIITEEIESCGGDSQGWDLISFYLPILSAPMDGYHFVVLKDHCSYYCCAYFSSK